MILLSSAIPQWKVNFHTHTTNSDGNVSPEEALVLYRAKAYDALCITDHGRCFPQREGTPLALNGIELNYVFSCEEIHIVGVGLAESMTEEEIRDALTNPRRGMERVHAHGGAAIFAHPAWSLNTAETLLAYPEADATEIYNSISQPPYNSQRGDSSVILDAAYARGCRYPICANDDVHFYGHDLTKSWTMVSASVCTREALVEAVRQGNIYGTQGPLFEEIRLEGDTITVRTSPVHEVIFFSNTPWVAHRTHYGEGMTEDTYTLHPNDKFVRIRITDGEGLSAWSSPIFVHSTDCTGR